MPQWGRLTFFAGTPLNTLTLTSLLLALITYFFLSRTCWGYEIRTLSGNPLAARQAGVNKGLMTIIVMLIGGGLAGLAGVFMLMSVSNVLVLGLSSNYGYVGIAVAMLATQHPIGSIFSSIYFAILYIGGQYTQITMQVPIMLVNSITAITILIAMLRTRIITMIDRFRQILMMIISKLGKINGRRDDRDDD